MKEQDKDHSAGLAADGNDTTAVHTPKLTHAETLERMAALGPETSVWLNAADIAALGAAIAALKERG